MAALISDKYYSALPLSSFSFRFVMKEYFIFWKCVEEKWRRRSTANAIQNEE